MRAYSTDLKERLVRAVAVGLPMREAARRFGVAVTTVKRAVVQQRATGSLARKPIPGRPRAISGKHEALLRVRLQAAPDATVLEHCAWWEEHQGQPLSEATMWRAILSSFYSFARRRELLDVENPISRLERRPVQRYAGACPLDAGDVTARLAKIDRTRPGGLRDYALLSLALSTGRRLSELAALDACDVALTDRGSRAVVTWRRVKGGKTMQDKLSPAATGAVLAWLHAAHAPHGADLDSLAADQPLWVSLSSNGTAGGRLSRQHIARTCEQRLGTSKVHALRHTFADQMEKAGAKLTDIQARLGHANAATTGLYLNALKAADNPYAEQLAAAFGIGTPAKASTRRAARR